MDIINFVKNEKLEVRIKPTLGAYCEIHVIDNDTEKHEVSIISDIEVRGRSGSQLEEIIMKHLNKLRDKVGGRVTTNTDVCKSW